MNAITLVLLFILLLTEAGARPAPEESARSLNRFILDSIKGIRFAKRQPQPTAVAKFQRHHTDHCLKLKWSGGDIEIFLNGAPVKTKRGGLTNYGAVHISKPARQLLHAGDNILVIRTLSKDTGLEASAGLIDWQTAQTSDR